MFYLYSLSVLSTFCSLISHNFRIVFSFLFLLTKWIYSQIRHMIEKKKRKIFYSFTILGEPQYNYSTCHFFFHDVVYHGSPLSYVFPFYQLPFTVVYSRKLVTYVSRYATMSLLPSVNLVSFIFPKTSLYVQEFSALSF